jgi:transcriptional regulator with XRE-family HTH domain
MINTKELKKLLIDKDLTIYDLAAYLGKSHSTVRRKLNGRSPMNLWEAEKIQGILEIENQDFGFYFLSHERGE